MNGVVRRGTVRELHELDPLAVAGLATELWWLQPDDAAVVLRYTGKGAVVSAGAVYKFIDQRGVDGFYNETATITGAAGGGSRRLQTGRLQDYAWVLVGSVGLFVLALAIFNG